MIGVFQRVLAVGDAHVVVVDVPEILLAQMQDALMGTSPVLAEIRLVAVEPD